MGITRMLMGAIERRLVGGAQMFDYTGIENKLSLTSAGDGTEVQGYAKIMPGYTYEQYVRNLKGVPYAQDIETETWCTICPDQCNEKILRKCPAIQAKIQLTNIKAQGITQLEWDNRFGPKPWYTQWWGILLICLGIILCGGCCVAAVIMSKQKNKKKRDVDNRVFESGMSTDTQGTYDTHGTQESQDLLEQELLEPDAPDGFDIGGIHDVGDNRLPFPEAGLPNTGQLPFPDAGVSHEHNWANQQVKRQYDMNMRNIRR